MSKKEVFDECIKEAIKMGREYMGRQREEDLLIPTKEEWALALVLFKEDLKDGI